jgi:hypothetical protein
MKSLLIDGFLVRFEILACVVAHGLHAQIHPCKSSEGNARLLSPQ